MPDHEDKPRKRSDPPGAEPDFATRDPESAAANARRTLIYMGSFVLAIILIVGLTIYGNRPDEPDPELAAALIDLQENQPGALDRVMELIHDGPYARKALDTPTGRTITLHRSATSAPPFLEFVETQAGAQITVYNPDTGDALHQYLISQARPDKHRTAYVLHGPVTRSGEPHGEWSSSFEGDLHETLWFWYDQEVTEAEWVARNDAQ